jgi:hypothetical protein
MIGFNASSVASTAAAADSVAALLAVIADPQRAQQFLVELRAVIEEGGKAAARAEIEKAHAEIVAQQKVNADRKNQLNQLEVGLGDLARDLRMREEKLAAQLAKLKALVPAAA